MKFLIISSRLLLGLVAGFVLANQVAILVPLYASNKVDAAIVGLLSAIVLYPLLILWAFASQKLGRLALIFMGAMLGAWGLISWQGSL